MYDFLLSYYETLSLRTSSTITLSETINVITSVLDSIENDLGFDDVWFEMIIRHLKCDTPYHQYFYLTTDTNFSDYFNTVTYYGSGYSNTSISFSNWGFMMYDFPTIPSSPYYSKVRFQMSGSSPFAIVVLDSAYNYSSVIYSNSNNYFQFTYDINTYRLGNVRFAVVNLTNVSFSSQLYIYQLN